jgi:N-acetyl-anhydromuramyl-L-alanine amidase AmpD
MLTELADVARRAGLAVVEARGWPGRGHGGMSGTKTVTVHHTAGPATGDAPSLATVRDGRPDLAGPLAHILLARSGTVHVVAAGLAWHAGATLQPWQANAYSIGIECEGTGRDPWPAVQYGACVRLCRALADHYRIPYGHILGHKEICSPRGRKVDPNFEFGVVG